MAMRRLGLALMLAWYFTVTAKQPAFRALHRDSGPYVDQAECQKVRNYVLDRLPTMANDFDFEDCWTYDWADLEPKTPLWANE